MKKEKRLPCSGIGGQAVLEGIMMRNGDEYAVAVRKPDKEIEVKKDKHKDFTEGKRIISLPFVRGMFKLIDSMVLGIKTLTYSANFVDEESIEPDRFETWLSNKFGKKAEKVIISFTILLSVVLAIGLFVVLPLFIAELMQKYIPQIGPKQVPVIEGVLKIVIFIIYLALTALMKDIKRTYMYHGAEHKCINAIETGKPLSVENVRKSSRFHKRCGTSFIFVVLLVSIFIFLLINPSSAWLRYGIRIILIPVIAGLAYEFIRKAGTSDGILVNIMSKPGLWMQSITTKEPTDDMIEVAIEAVESVFDWEEYLVKNGVEIIPKKDNVEPVKHINLDNTFDRPLPQRNNNTRSGYNWKF